MNFCVGDSRAHGEVHFISHLDQIFGFAINSETVVNFGQIVNLVNIILLQYVDATN